MHTYIYTYIHPPITVTCRSMLKLGIYIYIHIYIPCKQLDVRVLLSLLYAPGRDPSWICVSIHRCPPGIYIYQ